MEITDKRIKRLIKRFEKRLLRYGWDAILEYLEYPGGIVWITERQSKRKKDLSGNAIAYIKKAVEHGNTPGQDDIPLFKIVLIKEQVLALSDKEILHTLAHEVSHIFFKAKRRPTNFEEYACDTLADCFFGFKKPKGATLGYMHDEVAFKKIYGKALKKFK